MPRRRLPSLLGAGLVATLAVMLPSGALAQQPNAGDTSRVDTLAALPAATTPPAAAATSFSSTRSIASWPGRPTTRSEVLPFADNPAPRTYPEWAVTVGFGGFMSNFNEVNAAFRAVEDSIRARGFPVPASSDIRAGGLGLVNFGVSLNPALEAALQFGMTTDDELRIVGVLVSGRYTLPKAKAVALLGGLGGGAYWFRFQRDYNAQISPVDANGGYTTLDVIRLDGGGYYGTLAGRIAVGIGEGVTFEAVVQYFGMNDASTDAVSAGPVGAGPMSVNVSGTMLGASFRFSF